MTTDAYAALSSPTAKRGEPSGLATERLSLASAAVCLGILLWVIVNAYLGR